MNAIIWCSDQIGEGAAGRGKLEVGIECKIVVVMIRLGLRGCVRIALVGLFFSLRRYCCSIARALTSVGVYRRPGVTKQLATNCAVPQPVVVLMLSVLFVGRAF